MFSLLCLKAHLCNTGEDSVCLLTVDSAPTHSDEVNRKIQTTADKHGACRADSKVHGLFFPPSASVIKILL